MIKLPNYNTLKYEFDNLDNEESRMDTFFAPLVLKYHPDHLVDFMNWVRQFNTQQLKDIGLVIHDDAKPNTAVLCTDQGCILVYRNLENRLDVSYIAYRVTY